MITSGYQRVDDLKTSDDESIKAAELSKKIEKEKDGICIIGCDGRIVDVNTAFEKLTGYTRDELIGEFPSKVHPEREKKKISAGLKKCRKDGSTSSSKTVFLRKDKLKIPMQVEFDTYPNQVEATQFIDKSLK